MQAGVPKGAQGERARCLAEPLLRADWKNHQLLSPAGLFDLHLLFYYCLLSAAGQLTRWPVLPTSTASAKRYHGCLQLVGQQRHIGHPCQAQPRVPVIEAHLAPVSHIAAQGRRREQQVKDRLQKLQSLSEQNLTCSAAVMDLHAARASRFCRPCLLAAVLPCSKQGRLR